MTEICDLRRFVGLPWVLDQPLSDHILDGGRWDRTRPAQLEFSTGPVTDPMCVPPDSHVETLTPNVRVLGSGAFEVIRS